MKKLVTILLAIALIFAMSVPAFAADTANLTINGLEGRTYVGYKLLDLTTSHKANVNCGGTHNPETCYNYAYTVANDDYRTILQNEVFENGTTTAAAATDITDDQIIAYLADQSSGDYAEMRVVADRIYAAIKAAGLGADKTEFDGSASIDQGYWMFVDTTSLNGQNAANSFVMVDTKGETNLDITPKTALPTITKEVYDINDTTGANGWGDSADHDITDEVEFRLTATLAENYAYYETYKLVFHDDLADGLTLDTASFVVTAKNGDDVLDITDKFAITYPQDCDFEVTFDDVTAIDGVTKDTVFVVTYKATLNENAVVGTAGNANEVTLEFSNDPYSDSTGKTSAAVKVYTYQLVINKVDEEGNPLTGAGFTLYKMVGGVKTKIGEEVKGDGMTTFTWTGLDDGDYVLEESTVPAGYNKMADKEFTITAEHTKDGITTLTSGIDETDKDAGTLTEDIVNRTGPILPETGAMGTVALISVGSILVIVAAVFMITRKKMSVYED
ncbi:MAG: isopeptide-forming domain-containing fimbrial protein [Clostridia bacterium]|nr:isopeptide-forming domain-containing fimbrial protein [Clostridia bacterium]